MNWPPSSLFKSAPIAFRSSDSRAEAEIEPAQAGSIATGEVPEMAKHKILVRLSIIIALFGLIAPTAAQEIKLTFGARPKILPG